MNFYFVLIFSAAIFIGGHGTGSEFVPQCNPDEWFKCHDGLCVSRDWHCDGEPDCVDGSDELECPDDGGSQGGGVQGEDVIASPRSDSRTLSRDSAPAFRACDNATEFQCNKTVLCVPKYWLCDGVNDCTDNSDEEPEMCLKYKNELHCENELFFCNDTAKSCIPERWKCDGKSDCPGDFDEHPLVCNTTSNSSVPKDSDCNDGFQCKDHPTCLTWDLVCDNKADCPLGDDEGLECAQSCLNVNCKGSHQSCRGVPNGQGSCVCENGYQMRNDSTCVDVDECQMGIPPCSQKCTNSPGRFTCSCDNGYIMANDGNCRADISYPPAVLYFSGVTEIRSREIPSDNHYSLITNDRSKIRQAIGVTFDTSEQRIYWADVFYKAITSSNLDGGDFHTWNHSYIEKPEFLALDYLGHNFYYSDSKKKIIGVCTTSGHYCQSVISTGVTNPRGIAVQPDHGLLAYSNWDDKKENHPHIGLAGMDGEDVTILVNTSIQWPNGLAFDMPSNRLFWGEAYYDLLESIRLDGTRRISVKPSTNFMSLHPFSVAVFEDTIYWSDYGLRDIQSCHKFTGQNHKVVVKQARLQTYGIQIVHPLLEPAVYSPCNNNRCQHMCLLKKKKHILESVCRCADEFNLVNGHQCVPKMNFFIPLLPTSLDHRAIFGHNEPQQVQETTLRTTQKTTESPLPLETTTSSTTTPIILVNHVLVDDSTNDTKSGGLVSSVKVLKPDNQVEVIVGTIAAILCFVVCLILLYCCCYKKKRQLPARLIKTSQVFFKNPSFGLDAGLKDSNNYNKAEEELQTVEVIAPSTSKLNSGSGHESFNYYSVVEDDDCYQPLEFDTRPQQSRPVSEVTTSSQSDLMVDALQGDEDDKCQLLGGHED